LCLIVIFFSIFSYFAIINRISIYNITPILRNNLLLMLFIIFIDVLLLFMVCLPTPILDVFTFTGSQCFICDSQPSLTLNVLPVIVLNVCICSICIFCLSIRVCYVFLFICSVFDHFLFFITILILIIIIMKWNEYTKQQNIIFD
jgi:hypothetical protein